MKSHYVRQRGMAMVSVALSIFIMGTMGSYAMWRYVQLNQKKALDQTAVMVGERLREIDAAAKTYATEYFEQIQKLQDAKTKAGVVAVPAARVRSPELADLVSLRWLDSAHTNPVSFGGRDISFRVSYEVVGTNCSAVPTCLVKSLVVTTQPMIDSNTGDVDVGRANLAASAASKSNAGVSIPANFGGTPGNFVGVDGDFVSANSTNVAGLIGVIGGYDSQGFLAFDRRDGTLARTGSLRMKDDLGNKHDITGAKTVEVGEYLDLSTAAVSVEEEACAKTGLVSRNAEGLLLSCQSGLWKSALSSSQKLKWHNMSAYRYNGQTLINDKPYTIYVSIRSVRMGHEHGVTITVDGHTVFTQAINPDGRGYSNGVVPVPSGSTYSGYSSNGVAGWYEMF